jgi:hypothetical protein
MEQSRPHEPSFLITVERQAYLAIVETPMGEETFETA